MINDTKEGKLFSLHGELGYFYIFIGASNQFCIPLIIIGPRGFGKSELFYLLIKKFNNDYVKFIPVSTDNIIIEEKQSNIIFYSNEEYISIRGRNGTSWNRKTAIKANFISKFSLDKKSLQNGILLVGCLGIDRYQLKKEITRKRGHRIAYGNRIALRSIHNPNRYLFSLVSELYYDPPYYKQLVIFDNGPLKKIGDETRLISRIIEYFPKRILELVLPESENKWGQLQDVLVLLVEKMEILIIASVEERLSLVIKNKLNELSDRIQHEWRFPEDSQGLTNLSGIPEILSMMSWLKNKIDHYGEKVYKELPPNVSEIIDSGLLEIQTLFVERLGGLFRKGKVIEIDTLSEILKIHDLALEELVNNLLKQKKELLPLTKKKIKETKEKIISLEKFLEAVSKGEL